MVLAELGELIVFALGRLLFCGFRGRAKFFVIITQLCKLGGLFAVGRVLGAKADREDNDTQPRQYRFHGRMVPEAGEGLQSYSCGFEEDTERLRLRGRVAS